MSPKAKRILSLLGGVLIATLSQAYPAYAVLLASLGSALAGAGLITYHDAGGTSVLGVGSTNPPPKP